MEKKESKRKVVAEGEESVERQNKEAKLDFRTSR